MYGIIYIIHRTSCGGKISLFLYENKMKRFEKHKQRYYPLREKNKNPKIKKYVK